MLNYISRKINDTNFVWIEKFNQFIQFKDPAFFIFHQYAQDRKLIDIEKACSKKYNLPAEVSHRFVGEIITEVELQLSTCIKKTHTDFHYPDQIAFEAYSIYFYAFGNKKIKVKYQTRLLEHYVHPLLAHLHVNSNGENYNSLFELFYFNNEVILRHNGECLGHWNENDSKWIKGRFFCQLLNDIYDKTDMDWMATFHASAVTNGKKTIAFSAESGGGKSTFAALLHANGFQLVADDFVATDNNSFCAYPFPVAVSIKDGSLSVLEKYYTTLKECASVAMSNNRKGRYLSYELAIDSFKHTCPLTDMIFLKYNPKIEMEIQKINTDAVLQLIVNESWIQAKKSNIEVFLDWLDKTNFYVMQYSNNNKAIKAIKTIFTS